MYVRSPSSGSKYTNLQYKVALGIISLKTVIVKFVSCNQIALF